MVPKIPRPNKYTRQGINIRHYGYPVLGDCHWTPTKTSTLQLRHLKNMDKKERKNRFIIKWLIVVAKAASVVC